MKKGDLIEKVRRRFGYPLVKVELDDTQISDHIDYAREKFIKWAIGNAVQETYFTLLLSAGEAEYELPSGVTEVIGYDTRTAGSIHTLFTMENYLYNQGMYDQLLMRGATGGAGYSLISYHIARDFLETVKRYVVDAYNFKYHKYTNMLTISPTPPSGGVLIIDNVSHNTPGFILLRTYMVEGTDADIYSELWVLDYVTALSKQTLGRIRSKFANFTSIGSNTGLALDGDALLSESQMELEKLEEQLRNEQTHDGWGIIIG